MKISLIVTAIAAIIQLSLAIVVLLRSPFNIKNQILFVIILLFSLWSGLEIAISVLEAKEFLFKLIVDVIYLLAFFFLKFVSIFPKSSSFSIKYLNKNINYTLILIIVTVLIINHLGFIFRNLEFYENYLIINFSKLEFIIKGVLVLFLLLALKSISATYTELDSELHRKRMHYTIAAILFPAATGPIILALSKYYLETATLYPFGLFPTLSLITTVILTYAIMRYKLIEIDAIFTISLIYTLLSLILAGILEILENFLQDIFSLSEGWINIISVVAIAALFAPIKELVIMVINKIFGISRIDISKLIKIILTTINNSTSIFDLHSKLAHELSFVLTSKKIGLVLKKNSEIICIPNDLHFPLEILNFNSNSNYSDISDLDSIIDICEEHQFPQEDLFRELKKKDYKFLFKIKKDDEIKGFFLVGVKYNNAPYTPEEITLLIAINENLYTVIKNIELIQDLLDKHRLENELELAKKLYFAIKPKYVTQIENYEIFAFSTLAKEIKGDFIDINYNCENDNFILLIDAFNKGVSAVITIYILYIIFHYVSCESRLHLANAFLSKHNDPELKAAITYVKLNKSFIEIINLGNPKPIIINCDTKTLLDITEEAKPLGLLDKDYNYKPTKITLQKNQILLLYTNGLAKVFEDLDGTTLKSKIISELENITLSSLDRYLKFQINLVNTKSNFVDDVSYVCIWSKEHEKHIFSS